MIELVSECGAARHANPAADCHRIWCGPNGDAASRKGQRQSGASAGCGTQRTTEGSSTHGIAVLRYERASNQDRLLSAGGKILGDSFHRRERLMNGLVRICSRWIRHQRYQRERKDRGHDASHKSSRRRGVLTLREMPHFVAAQTCAPPATAELQRSPIENYTLDRALWFVCAGRHVAKPIRECRTRSDLPRSSGFQMEGGNGTETQC
jgi:hypothetical protein